uniref:RNA helicase n=1 Tax=Romanomermis culicivorax TaxID=13658 RepID=A0A915KMY1_ROMCU
MHESTNKNLKPKSREQWPFEPEAVILAPTRELAIQISEEARIFAEGTSVKPCCLYGGTAPKLLKERLRRDGSNMLIATPGRLADFIDCGYIKLYSKCRYFILDEADRMLEMGFRYDIHFIADNMKSLKDRQTLMFSATFPKLVQKLANNFLSKNYPFIAVGMVGAANRDICQTVKQVDSQSKKDHLLEILSEDLSNNQPISKFFQKFVYGRKLFFICRRIDQAEREEILKNFKSGICPILIATAIAARGLDIAGVDHVINYDVPKSRIGNVGRATSFYDAKRDSKIARYMVKILLEAQQEVPDFLQALVRYIGDTGVGKSGSKMVNDWE